MASSPITSWQISWEKLEIDFIFLGSKITVDGKCSHEIKRKKSYDKPRQYIKKQRHHFANKVHIVKALVFPVVLCGCESWTILKAERQRIDAFNLWCWGRLLRVPWTAKRSNQSMLKKSTLNIHWKDPCWSWSWSWISNTLAMWYEVSTYWKRHWWWERLNAGGEGGNRGWDGSIVSPTQWTWVWTNSMRLWRTRKPGLLRS